MQTQTAAASTRTTPGNAGEPSELLIQDDPFAFFNEHGFGCIRGVIGEEDARAAAPVVEAIQNGTWGDGTQSTQARQAQRSLALPISEAPTELLRIFASPQVQEVIYTSHGSDNIRFAGWVIFHRPAKAEGTMWHADAGHMPFHGNVVQYWLPLAPLPNRQGLKFKGDLGEGESIYTFGDLGPGDLTMHRQTTHHAGQTYSTATTGVSFITYEDGVVLEDHLFPVFHHARLTMMASLFPGKTFGDVAAGDLTPFVRDIAVT
jgi:hypothetical protein